MIQSLAQSMINHTTATEVGLDIGLLVPVLSLLYRVAPECRSG